MSQHEENWFLNGKKVIKRSMLSKASQSILYGVSIALESSFGCLQSPIRRNSYFVSDDVMMFLSGKHIVMYDIIRRKQSYIMKPGEDEQVQALNFCVTTTKTLLVAMAFRSTSKILPTVKVYNRQKQRFYQLVHSHLLPNSTVFEVAFVNNGKNLVTLTKSDEGYGVSVFQITKEITVQFNKIKTQVSFIECLVANGDEFIIGGPNFLSLYSYSSEINLLDEVVNYYMMIPALQPNEIIIDCAALNFEKLKVVVTNQNRFILFKGKHFLRIVDCYIEDPQTMTILLKDDKNKPQQKKKHHDNFLKPKVSTISKTDKGFVIGMVGRPILEVFEFTKDTNELLFKGSYMIKDENIFGIHQVHLAADEMYAALTVVYFNKSAYAVAKGQDREEDEYVEGHNETNQSHDTPSCEVILDQFQGKIELFTFNLAIVEALKTVQKEPFEPLFEKGVHRGNILNLATTPMRAVIASVCEDKTCKFWDYQNDFKELFSHQFHETPNCVALHPLSFLCAIGFKEGMRLYYVLDDDLKLLYTENMKSCTAIGFSDGGHLLAASNTTQVYIFHPIKFTHLYTFSNHQSNLKELYFQENDQFLVTICQLGVLYVWNLQNGQRHVDHAQKANKYNAVTYDSYYDLVVGACADHKVRVYTDKGMNLALEHDTSPTQFSSICISIKYGVIFFGTTQGSIRIYTYPFYHFNPKTMEYIEVPVHQGAVTQIKVSPDNSYLITASADGSIFFSKIKQFSNGVELSQLDQLTQGDQVGKYTNTFAFNPLSLSSRITQDNRKEQIKELDFRLLNFKSDIDDEKERLISFHNSELKQKEDINLSQLNLQREDLSVNITRTDQATQMIKSKISNFKKDHKDLVKECEEEESLVLLKLYEQRNGLQSLLDSIKDKQRSQKDQGLKEYEQTLTQVDEEYLRKYQELYQRFSEAMTNMKSDQRKFKEVLQQGEKEYETFYKDSQKSLQDDLTVENKITEDFRSSISKFTKENERLQHRRDFLEGLIKDTTNQVQNLSNELISYQDKHKNMIMQLSEKEDLINQREQQIKDFRMKNVHLQNFQKVYDYRVNTLKDEREPLLEHLKNMDKHVKNLYNELIEEAGLKQQYELDRVKSLTKINQLKDKLGQTFNQASLTQRKINVTDYEISKLLTQNTHTWLEGLNMIQQQLEQENKGNFALQGSIFSETMKDMQKDPIQEQIDQITQQNIQKELQSQKNFLKKKLVNVQVSVKQNIDERHQTYYSIQSTNTQLINECNHLRDTKQRLKDHIDKQTKAFREIRRELHCSGIEMPENPEINTGEEDEEFQQQDGDQFEELSVQRDVYPRHNESQNELQGSRKTPYAQYEEQQQKYSMYYKIRKALSQNQNFSKQKAQTGQKFFNDLFQEVKTNINGDEDLLREKFRIRTNAFLKPSESQTILPSVISKTKEIRPQLKSQDPRQLLTAGITASRTTKMSTATNFFVQTHSSNFTQKQSSTPNPLSKSSKKNRPQQNK